jgi:hypothetical protein
MKFGFKYEMRRQERNIPVFPPTSKYASIAVRDFSAESTFQNWSPFLVRNTCVHPNSLKIRLLYAPLGDRNGHT